MNSNIEIWGYSIPRSWLSEAEIVYLDSLPPTLPSVNWVWAEMDRVWKLFSLNNCKPLNGQLIAEFYSHPVWLMNGIFTAVDPVSSSHRSSIARYLSNTNAVNISDYGGGFGQLARSIISAKAACHVSIVEPYPTRVAKNLLDTEQKINLVNVLTVQSYDAIIAQDVLEHVEDPVELAFNIANAVKEGGLIIFANCFYPVIQCHLPSTFHLRHFFKYVMRSMGLSFSGVIDGAEHALVFIRNGNLDLASARSTERLSKLIAVTFNPIHRLASSAKHLTARL